MQEAMLPKLRFDGGGGCDEIYALVSALKICSRTKDVQTGMKIHAAAIKQRFHLNRFLANTLLDMYAKCGRMIEARQVFDAMKRRCVISWTALILGYVQSGESELALKLFSRMINDDKIAPDGRTIYAALGACVDLVSRDDDDQHEKRIEGVPVKLWCLNKGKALHEQIASSGLGIDIFVASVLVDLYSACGRISEAQRVFDEILEHSSSMSWNSLINGYAQDGDPETSLKLFGCMQQTGMKPDARTFIAVLKACSASAARKEGDRIKDQAWCLKKGCEIHSQISESRHQRDAYVVSTLVDMYSKCGCMIKAQEIFDSLARPCNVTWNAIIMGYAQSGECEKALEFFFRMSSIEQSQVPDARTYVSALKACSNLAATALKEADKRVEGVPVEEWCLVKGREIHRRVFDSPHSSNIYVCNILVDMYAKCGSVEEARSVFDAILRPTVMSWNAMIMGYAVNGKGEEALELFRRMSSKPDARSFVAALKACSGFSAKDLDSKKLVYGKPVKIWCLENGAAIHAEVLSRGLEKDVFVASTLVDMYASCREMAEARKVFDGMVYRNAVLWNAMILGYANVEGGGGAETALNLFAKMQLEEGVAADNVTVVAVLKACGILGKLETGREIHGEVVSAMKLEEDVLVAASLIDFYGKCGSMIDAEAVFGSVSNRNLVIWNALIGGYTHQADAKRVFEALEMMKADNLAANEITFLCVLNCCSHAGLVERGKEVFEMMVSGNGLVAGIEHYTCMVDLLGRSNRLDEALEMVRRMPYEANEEIWLTLLSACRKWGNVEVAKFAFESVMKVNDGDSAAYLLMNSIYIGDSNRV